METRAQREVSFLRPLSQQVSDLGFKSRQPDFSTCAGNPSAILPERHSQQGRNRLPPPESHSKHQRPNRTVVPLFDCHISPAEQRPSPWHDILALPKSGLFPAAPLTHPLPPRALHAVCLQPFAEAVLIDLSNAHTAPACLVKAHSSFMTQAIFS